MFPSPLRLSLAALACLPLAALPALADPGPIAAPDAVSAEAIEITPEGTLATPLTSEPGDGYRGVLLFMDEAVAGCTSCHYNADVAATGQGGDIGPSLSLIGDKDPGPKLRAILVDAPAVFGADTVMPAFFVPDENGETRLTAQQIEDLVAYLSELHLYTR